MKIRTFRDPLDGISRITLSSELSKSLEIGEGRVRLIYIFVFDLGFPSGVSFSKRGEIKSTNLTIFLCLNPNNLLLKQPVVFFQKQNRR